MDNQQHKDIITKLKKIYQDGPNQKGAVNILELLPREDVNSVLTLLKEDNKIIYYDIRELIVFDDLQRLASKDIEKLIKHFDSQFLGLALRLGSEQLKKSFLEKISEEEKEAIQSVLSGSPRKKSEVEAAMRQIVNYVRRMQEQGSIRTLINPNDDALG